MTPIETLKAELNELAQAELCPDYIRAQLAAVESLEADLESTRRALEKEVAVCELATNEAKEWQSRALKAERMVQFVERQQLAPSIEREKALEAENAKLREALGPFAHIIGPLFFSHMPDDFGLCIVAAGPHLPKITVGDLRRAAQVLAETGGVKS